MFRVVIHTDAPDPRDQPEVREEVMYSRSGVNAVVNHALATAPFNRSRSITIVLNPDRPAPRWRRLDAEF